ncbi:MAG: hypothetical protein WC358_03270 [Ignavibacteria bacterium]|jgi:hypothetical protein
MSLVQLSETENKIIQEYSRIKGLSVDILLRKGVDSVVREALLEQIKLDYSNKNISADVIDLFTDRDYIRLIFTTPIDKIPASIINNLANRASDIKQ